MMTKIARNVFLVVFAFSTVLALGLALTVSAVSYSPAVNPSTQAPESTPEPGQSIAENEKPALETGNLALISTLATSLASLIGFVTTTAITWRKEKRESALAEVERKKLELELEKSKLELEEMKREKKK
jgi:hypothetical protein